MAETPSLAAIDRFLDAVWMERGLSPNTLSAYRADLTAHERWLDQHQSDLTAAKRGDLLSFMAWRVQAGARPRSTARQLSSFRRFYRHLVREGVLEKYGVELIAASREAIDMAEDRERFRNAMREIGLESPRSRIAARCGPTSSTPISRLSTKKRKSNF